MDAAVLIGYYVEGVRRSEVAHRYLRNQNTMYWFPPLPEPDLFTEEGQLYRQRAMRYWKRGGLVVIAYLVLSAWLRRFV